MNFKETQFTARPSLIHFLLFPTMTAFLMDERFLHQLPIAFPQIKMSVLRNVKHGESLLNWMEMPVLLSRHGTNLLKAEWNKLEKGLIDLTKPTRMGRGNQCETMEASRPQRHQQQKMALTAMLLQRINDPPLYQGNAMVATLQVT